MRSRSRVIAFVRLCAASGLGAYLGGAVAGLAAVLTGETFAAGSRWLATLPVLAVVGAGVGTAVAWLTRRWLLPRMPRRALLFTAAGIVTLPLFTAISQLRAIESIGVPLVVVGAVAMVTVYLRATRPSSSTARGSYSRSGTR